MNINFSGVEVAAENVGGSAFVAPGTQNLTITELKLASAKSGNEGIEVFFSSDKGGAFSQRFWLVDKEGNTLTKAAPSFQYLVEKFTGKPLDGNVNVEALTAMLVGKTTLVTVGGRRATIQKDGKSYDNTYAWLPFGGWAGEGEIRYTGAFDATQQDAEKTVTAAEDDLPF